MKRQIVAMMMVVLLSAAAENVRADVQYIVTDLGDLGGTSGSVAYDLNDSGQVVGTSYNTRGSNQVFLYSGSGPMQELGISAGAGYKFVINDSGQIAGTYQPLARSFLYTPGQPIVYGVGDLGGGFGSQVQGINNSGQVVGWCPGSPERAFLYSGGATTYLDTLSGGNWNKAYAINNVGQVVGVSDMMVNQHGATRAFLYSGGSMRDLGFLGTPYDINDSGQIVGGFGDGGNGAFLYSGNGPVQDLRTPGENYSAACGINNRGQVVGYVGWPDASISDNAFLYADGVMHDLNSLVPPVPGQQLKSAVAINDRGQIVCNGVNASGQSHAFLLTRIPGTISLSGASNGVIIAGGTADLGVTVTNSAGAGADNLNYSLAAAVQSGIATLGGVAPGSGSLAPGASAANSVSATSTTVGLNTLRFTASDTLASNSPQTADVTLTVLDHAAVVFTDGSGILNLDFGTILVGSGTHSLHYRIQNLPGQYRAGLDMDDITEVSDPAGIFSTNAAGFANLRPGLASSFFDVFLECSERGQFAGQYRFSLSDQDGMSGSTGGQVLTLNVTANVVPEPSTLALLGIGAIGLLAYGWRRRTMW